MDSKYKCVNPFKYTAPGENPYRLMERHMQKGCSWNVKKKRDVFPPSLLLHQAKDQNICTPLSTYTGQFSFNLPCQLLYWEQKYVERSASKSQLWHWKCDKFTKAFTQCDILLISVKRDKSVQSESKNA